MKHIRYSQRAAGDLESIADYTGSNWGAEKAKQYLSEIRRHIKELAKGDAFYQPLPVSRSNIFKSKVNRHFVIFELAENQVSVLRILHEAMDIPRHILPRS